MIIYACTYVQILDEDTLHYNVIYYNMIDHQTACTFTRENWDFFHNPNPGELGFVSQPLALNAALQPSPCK